MFLSKGMMLFTSATVLKLPDTVGDANRTTTILAKLSLWLDSIALTDRKVLLITNLTIITFLS